MLIKELPPSERIACGSDVDEIGAALRKALEGSMSAAYRYMTPLSEKSVLGYALSSWAPSLDTIRLPESLTPTKMAARLVHTERYQICYHPPTSPGEVKGWEIRRAVIDDEPLAIALAIWVPPYLPQMPSFI
jgi:hypothetical protein